MNAQIKALFIDTVKKEARNKTLIFALVFSTASIFIGYSLVKFFMQSGVAVNDSTTSMAINVMMSFLNFWAMIISIFFGVSAVRSDFQDNIIYQYLSFPISRTMYFLVRLIGTWSMVFAFYLYSYLLTFILFSVLSKSFQPTLGQLESILIMGVYTFVYVVLAFLVSLFMDKLGAFISLIFISGIITVSNSNFSTLAFADYFKDFSVMKLVFFVIHWFMPHLGTLSEMANGVLKGLKMEFNFPLEIIHFIITTALLIFIANRLVKKKDF